MTPEKRMMSVLATALVPLLVAGSGVGSSRSKPFALVYQSDTRGYYRPCG